MQKGFSLIEIIISLGIITFTALAFASVINNQNREAKSLNEKLTVLDLEKFLMTNLNDGKLLTAELTDGTLNPEILTDPNEFAININDLDNEKISLKRIHANVSPGSPDLIALGGKPYSNSPSIEIAKIDILNFVSSGTADKFFAELQVGFKPDKMVRSLKPITLKITVITDPTSSDDSKKVLVVNSNSSSGIDAKIRCELLNGEFDPVNQTCKNYVGQMGGALWGRKAHIQNFGPADSIATEVLQQAAPTQSLWAGKLLDGVKCNADKGWQLTGCWISRKQVADVDAVPHIEVINGNEVITGCLTNDTGKVEITILCIKNF